MSFGPKLRRKICSIHEISNVPSNGEDKSRVWSYMHLREFPNLGIFRHWAIGAQVISKMIPVIGKNEAATHIFSHEIRQLLGTNSGKDSLGDRWRPRWTWRLSVGQLVNSSSGDFSGIFLDFFWDFSGIIIVVSDMKSIRSCFLFREPGRSQWLLGLFHVVPLTSCIRWGGSVMIKGVNLGDVTNLLPGVACVLCCPCTSFVFFLSINAMNIFQKLANLTWKKTTFFHCSTQYSRWCSCWMFANYEAFLSYRDISRPQLGWNMIRMGRQFMLRFHIPKKEYCTVYIYINTGMFTIYHI